MQSPNVKQQQMNFLEKITLSPFQKYVRFNRFPWKFIFHLLLLILTTYQAMKIVTIQDKHTRIQQQIFSTIYLQSDDGSSSVPYYNLSQFTDSFFGVIDQTNLLNETLLQYSNITDVNYNLRIYYTEYMNTDNIKMVIQGDQQQFLEKLDTINLTRDDYRQNKQFLQKVENMVLTISNLTTWISINSKGQFQSCLNWTIAIQYSLESFANVQTYLTANSFECIINEKKIDDKQSLLGIHIAIIVIACLSLLLDWRQFYNISKQYMYYKQKMAPKDEVRKSRFKSHMNWEKNWQDLGFFDKLKFFDFWFVVTVSGNFFQLFGALVGILDEVIRDKLAIFQHKQILIGLGVMLAWITILKYLQYSSNLNLMTSTLSKSWGNLFIFLLGVMPFFLGFVFLGQTIFWKYNKFEDTSSSVITLFSLLNGDIVNDTFLETWAEGLAGQLYLIIFMVLFYTAVQNVFVTIIMEGYQQSIKERQHKKMLQEKQEKEQLQFQQNLLNIQDQEPLRVPSPSLSPQQNIGLFQVKLNGKKIDAILNQVQKLTKEIDESQLSNSQKQHLKRIINDNLQSVSTAIKMQLKEIS